MKKLFTLCLSNILAIISMVAVGQDIQKGAPGMWPAMIKYTAVAPDFKQSSILMPDGSGRLVSLTNGKISRSETDNNGIQHIRYQQYLNGIAIENAILVMHVNNGKVSSQNGKWIKDIPSMLSSRASINSSAALEFAKKYVGAKSYKWEIPAEEARLKNGNPGLTYSPHASLVYYSGEQDVMPSALRLAWKFDIYAQEPLSRQLVFVDAENGQLLGKRSLIYETNTPGTGITVYSGSQPITTDYTGTNYRLRETGRGNGINTYNLQKGYTYSLAVDFTDADNIWNNVNANKDQYAADAHWATEKTYDYYFTKFNRNSIDNAGFALNSYVHYSTNYFNAFWDGNQMTYGDGDASDGYKPLTSVDVCGHEITHGLTSNTSNLIYNGESGAMNEGFSDIFGTAIEFYARPSNANWLLGSDFYTIRNMSNPNAFNQPDTYEGTYWYTGSSDNGGVHTNSGVLNYWFYLLTVGGVGTNDHGTAYNVTGIGIDNAAAIAYRLNTYYLTSTADFMTARILGIQAAEDLFGVGSPQAVATANAWTAVGLYGASCNATAGLVTTNVQDFDATLTWNSSPGATNYRVQFKPSTSTSWTDMGTTVDTFMVLTYYFNPSTTYNWRVKSSCNGLYSYAQFTTTPPQCHPPSSLTFVVNGTNVTFNWATGIYASSYVLEYKPAADTSWTRKPPFSGSSTSVSGLANATLYDWRVRSTCSFDTSGWVNSQFTTDIPLCNNPAGLATDFLPVLVTKMHWNPVPGAVNYQVQIKRTGGSWPGTESGVQVFNDTLYSETGFMSGMIIDWRVRSFCGNNYSNYTQSQYTTPIPAPINLAISNLTANSATVSWANGGANSPFGYGFSYKLSTATTWVTYSATASTSITLGLQQGKIYDCRVRQNGADVNSLYTQTQFTTPCTNIPGSLNTDKVTTNTAIVKWGAVSGTTTYNLQYKTTAATTWNTITGITTNNYTLSGLTASTAYKFKVQSLCTVGANAGYSAEGAFTTYCVSSGNNSQEWINYFKFGTMERYSGADAGGYFNAATSYTAVSYTMGTTVSGLISAAFSSGVKNQYYAIYIDLNRNGSYADAGERVAGQSTITSTGLYGYTVTIPLTASAGVTGLRVVMLRQPTATAPCLTGNRGETEDYLITLVAPTSLIAQTVPVYTNNATMPESDITVSPNPSTGKYTIAVSGDFNPIQFDIMNASGILVKNGNMYSQKQLNIDITSLPGGVYLLRLTDGSGRKQVVKLVKN